MAFCGPQAAIRRTAGGLLIQETGSWTGAYGLFAALYSDQGMETQ
jgi:hypothetical protein